MLLSTGLSLISALKGLSQSEQVAYFQTAYESIINKIRLDIGIFPFMMDEACKIDKLDAKSTIITSDSEIAFKEIPAFLKCDLQQDPNSTDTTDYTLTDSVIGNPSEDFFGYNETTFDEINEDQVTTPELYVNGRDIICTNMDTAFFNILAYKYPYPVTVSDGDEYTVEYRYDIQWMIDTYTIANVSIDDLLFWFISLRAVSAFYMDQCDPGTSQTYKNLLMEYINLYNRNPNQFKHSKPSIIAGIALHTD